jgi:hypothetical protein
MALPVRAGDSALDQKAKLEQSRLKMKGLLEQACESGNLNQALATVLPPKPAQQAAVPREEFLRAKMRNVLETATESGKLAEALSSVPSKPKDEARESLKSMKLTELQKRASALGATPEEIEAATDNEANPKGALIDLCLSRQVSLRRRQRSYA